MKTTLTLVFILSALASSLALGGDPVVLDKPVRVEVLIKPTEKAREQKLIGDLISYDDDSVTIKTRQQERTLKWIDLTPGSAFDARRATIDKSKATDWLKLGEFGWSINAGRRAEAALATAVKLDASLKSEVATITSEAPGSKLKPPPATEPALANNGPAIESPGSASVTEPPSRSKAPVPADQVVKYQKSTPEEDAQALSHARAVSKQVAEKLELTFAEFETDHFIVFTDWAKGGEQKFLRDNLEAAYALVSKSFDIPVKENIFVGKLPVFMFNTQDDFKRFASQIDEFTPGDGVAGYYAQFGKGGIGHMVMWKPDVSGNNGKPAETRWARTLTHEFTHAFIARYRSNQHIPRWLNEGLAEVIAESKFPSVGYTDFARRMAIQKAAAVPAIFDDAKMPGGEMYPVMMTMVQMLVAKDRKAFIAYFNDIKSGEDPEKALKKFYNIDHAQLVKNWKTYLSTGRAP